MPHQSRTLAQWLEAIEQAHPAQIEMGLERAGAVFQRQALHFNCPIILVGGTNGKGTTCRVIEQVLLAAGLRTAVYSSPHLVHYNERLRINGELIDDASLCASFAAVDGLRGDIALTYFEFGTLAAFDIVAKRQDIDCFIVEVGLGGRLDVTNLLSPDISIVTSIDFDHTDWLGDTLAQIGWEKAHIFRAQKPAIVGMAQPPQSLLDYAQQIDAKLHRFGQDFAIDAHRYQGQQPLEALPASTIVPSNIACAFCALELLPFAISDEAKRQGLANSQLVGRLALLQQQPQILVDVAHNPEAARYLAQWLCQHPVAGRTIAVVAMLADKDIESTFAMMAKANIDEWHCAQLDNPRAAPVARLQQLVAGCAHANVAQALAAARQSAQDNDRIIVFGSFFTVAEVYQQLGVAIR